ncbi:MAG: hypothetical protein WCE76_29030 [Mycobacterium sp.]
MPTHGWWRSPTLNTHLDVQPDGPFAPPLLGEHTDEILTDVLGKTPDEIARLRASGAI